LYYLVILAAWTVTYAAQFAPLPQADSSEEFDVYLAVLDAPTPAAVIAAGDAFLKAWPESKLRGHVWAREFEAYRRLGNEDKAIQAGESALAASPDNLLMLADLSGVLANGAKDPERLARAEQYARKAIELSKSLKIPRLVSPREWAALDARLNSSAHAALGLVANQRHETQAAIREFEFAVRLAPEPDPTQHYRLGLLYRAAGNLSGALEQFRKAEVLHEPAIQELVRQELQRLEHR
jgi:tetratricopeptide (TPR) repeat protein